MGAEKQRIISIVEIRNGITLSHFQSGTSVNGKSHISRLGSKKIRKVLYMSSLVVKNHNPEFANFRGKA
ncbi:MAG: IS110 family transposase [Holosporaceae bacterium]|nr:IS110 family transposase [Holosporaceae bacterium]